MASTLGKVNPFRYRGYVYDEETGLYYLRSRYYTAFLCRFINADNQIARAPILCKCDVFTYCLNNPNVHSDSNGTHDVSVIDQNSLEYKLALAVLSAFEWRVESTVEMPGSFGVPGLIEFKQSVTTGAAYRYSQGDEGVFLVGGVNVKNNAASNTIYGICAYGGYTDAILGITVCDNALSIEIGMNNQTAMVTVGFTEKGWASTFDISYEYTVYNNYGGYSKSTYTLSINSWLAIAVAAVCVFTPEVVPVLDMALATGA